MTSPEPFFGRSRGSGANAAGHRLLLVSYHFPPSRAVGGLRWQKFARHLSEAGYPLDVLTLSPDDLAKVDRARLDDLPDDIRVFAVPDVVPYADRIESRIRALLDPLYRLRSRGKGQGGADADRTDSGRKSSLFREEILESSFSPRELYRSYRSVLRHLHGGRWAARARRLALELVRVREYSAVISSGPPHFVHRAARDIAEESGLPLVLDFRDPWSLATWLPEEIACPLWLRLSRREERRCVERARLVVVNTDPHREEMARVHRGASEKLVTVMNGYDEEEREAIAGSGGRERGDRFLVVYTGSIYGKRDPRPFLRAAGEFVGDNGLSPQAFGIEFIGNAELYDGQSVPEIAAAEGLAEHFAAPGSRPRREALARSAEAALLLSLPQETELCIPAKIFEYMMMPSWVLAMEREGSATERVLRSTGADVVEPGDVEGIQAVLESRYREWRSGKRPEGISDGPLSRRSQSRHLIRSLEEHLSTVDRSIPTPD